MASVLQVARALVGLSSAEVRAALGAAESDEAADDYQGLEDVTSIRGARFPGVVYLRDGMVELVYLGPDAVAGLSVQELERAAGDAGSEGLASRAGPASLLVVHATAGLAYSTYDGGVQFVEVFGPCSQSEYEARIYADPGPFLR